MLDLIERTKLLIANHPEYMRHSICTNVPGGHGQRMQKYSSEVVNPYFKRLCLFDMSPDYRNQIMFAQDFKINSNKIVVLQSNIDSSIYKIPGQITAFNTIKCQHILDTFNKLIQQPNTKHVRRILNQSEVKAIMVEKCLIPTLTFYTFFIEMVNKVMVQNYLTDTSMLHYSFTDGILFYGNKRYDVFRQYNSYLMHLK